MVCVDKNRLELPAPLYHHSNHPFPPQQKKVKGMHLVYVFNMKLLSLIKVGLKTVLRQLKGSVMCDLMWLKGDLNVAYKS